MAKKDLFLGKDKKGNIYYECIQCGTTKNPYGGHGLCKKCYSSKFYIKNKDQARKRYLKNTYSQNKKCNDCGKLIIDSAKKCRQCELKSRKINKWSRKYDKCIICGTTKIEHHTNGLCNKCRQKQQKHCLDCGRLIHYNAKRCRNCAKKQKKGQPILHLKEHQFKKGFTPWNKDMKGIDLSQGKGQFKKGHFVTKEERERMSRFMKGRYIGEKNPMWEGGISFEPYGLDFNKRFKEMIRKRDNCICMLCNKPQEELKHNLSVHHIDYIKINNFPQNCISLCRKCHGLTHYNRSHWKTFFQNLLKELYQYEYSQDQKIILDFRK